MLLPATADCKHDHRDDRMVCAREWKKRHRGLIATAVSPNPLISIASGSDTTYAPQGDT
jgi:hypothetical protein